MSTTPAPPNPTPVSKFLRQFWMQVQGQTRIWTITSPLTLEFDVDRALNQGMQTGTFTIYNLGAAARSDIYLDANNQFTSPRQVIVRAGYASWQTGYGPQTPQSYPIIFAGQLYRAYSVRSGPSWMTKIDAWDAGQDMSIADASVPFSKQDSFATQIRKVAAVMPNVKQPIYISPEITATVSRGGVHVGKPWDIITEMARGANADVFIDLGNLYMVPKGQAVPGLTGGLNLINSDSGLLNTPIKQQFVVSFDMLFEPRLTIGQNINIQSLESENNGNWVLQGLKHSGIISDAVDGDCITTPILWDPNASLGTQTP